MVAIRKAEFAQGRFELKNTTKAKRIFLNFFAELTEEKQAALSTNNYGNWYSTDQYWHSNGIKAREGEFIDGKPNGTHKYWYQNGQLRGIGNWKVGVYDGKWEMYNEDGKEKIIQNYKDGKLVE